MEQNYVTNVGQQEPKFKFPTEIVELPSKGLLYPEENPLVVFPCGAIMDGDKCLISIGVNDEKTAILTI